MAHQLLNNNIVPPTAINVFVIDAIFLRDHARESFQGLPTMVNDEFKFLQEPSWNAWYFADFFVFCVYDVLYCSEGDYEVSII